MPLLLLTVGLMAQNGTSGFLNTVGVFDVAIASIALVFMVFAAVLKASDPK